MRIVSTLLFGALLTVSAYAQTTYTWNQTSPGAFGTAANWTPTRTTPATNDILVFDGSTTPNAVVTGLASQTIGKLVVQNNAYVSFVASSAATLTLSGGSNALQIGAGSTLLDSANSAITIALPTGNTGDISGTFRVRGATSATAHKLTGTDASSITFESGSLCVIDTLSSSNLFGTTALNSVVFKSGAIVIQRSGSNPFGASAPNSVIVFQSGSKFSSQWTGTPSFSGRTYADFELNVPGGAVTVTGGSAVSINNLIITAGRLNFNMTGTPGHSIKGDITVGAGDTLGFAPASAGTVNLNGTPTQLISGGGVIFTGLNSTIKVNNSGGVSLGQSITDSGSVIVDSSLSTSTYSVSGPGKFTLSAGGTLWLGGPNGVNDLLKTTGTNSLGTAGNFYFDGGGPQVTGTMMPDTIAEIKTFTSTGLTLSKTTLANKVTLTGAGIITTAGDTLIAPNGIGGSYGAGAYVDGSLLYNVTVTGAWIFPVGSGFTAYLPATLNFTALTGTGAVVVSVIDASKVLAAPAPDSIVALKRYYMIGKAAGISAFTSDVTLSYSAGDMAGIGVTKDSLLHVYQSADGTTWMDLPITARDTTHKTITVSGLSSFGTFLIGTRLTKVTIAQARKDDNHDLIPDYSVTGDALEVFGVVTTQNMQAIQGNTSYSIQDGTAGITVFAYGAPPLTYSIGDSVFVKGKVAQYHGLTEITPLSLDSIYFGIIKHNATVPSPVHLTLHNYAQNAETYESQLVAIIDTLYKTSGTWPTAGSQSAVYVTNRAKSDTIQIYISKNTNLAGWPEPSYPITVVGAVSQYASGTTLNTGYEIMPRDTNDVKRVATAPVSPLLPANNASFQRADTLLFKWSKSLTASKYLFQLSTTRAFSSYVVNDSNVTDTTRKVTGLLNLTKYYWHVSAYNVTAFGSFSATDSFTTIIAAPAKPVLVSPVAVKSVPRRTTFKWNTCVNATKYRLQVSTDTNFTSVVFDTTLADTSKKLSTGLTASTKYYWRVSASDTGGTSPYAIASYTTGTGLDGIDEQTGLPKEFALYQNYPNPFNPTTTIKFDLPKESQVQIEIFNVLGQRVMVLVDDVVRAGSHVVTFNASRLASGVYFYVMKADEKVFKHKMLLMK